MIHLTEKGWEERKEDSGKYFPLSVPSGRGKKGVEAAPV